MTCRSVATTRAIASFRRPPGSSDCSAAAVSDESLCAFTRRVPPPHTFRTGSAHLSTGAIRRRIQKTDGFPAADGAGAAEAPAAVLVSAANGGGLTFCRGSTRGRRHETERKTGSDYQLGDQMLQSNVKRKNKPSSVAQFYKRASL